MELRILRIGDDFLEIEAVDEDPSILDSLAEILQKIDGVEYAGIAIEHPLTMKTILRVMTNKQKIKSKDALIKALNELSTIVDELAEKVKQL